MLGGVSIWTVPEINTSAFARLMQPLKHLSNKAAHINGKLCRQFVSLVNLNQSRHESKCRDSNEQATSEQATGKQARQPVKRQGNRQPVNRQGNRCSGKMWIDYLGNRQPKNRQLANTKRINVRRGINLNSPWKQHFYFFTARDNFRQIYVITWVSYAASPAQWEAKMHHRSSGIASKRLKAMKVIHNSTEMHSELVTDK